MHLTRPDRFLLSAALTLAAACDGPADPRPGNSPTAAGAEQQPTGAPGPNATSTPRGHAPPPVSAPTAEVKPHEGRTPGQLGSAIMAGFDDLSLVPSLYPSDALLRRALDCQDEEIYTGIAAMRTKASSEMGARPAASTLFHLRTTEATGYGEPELHPPGATISGCTTLMEVELRVHSVAYTMITPQGTEIRGMVMLFVRFGDYGWYVFE